MTALKLEESTWVEQHGFEIRVITITFAIMFLSYLALGYTGLELLFNSLSSSIAILFITVIGFIGVMIIAKKFKEAKNREEESE